MAETVALIELGSNAVRFEIAQIDRRPGVRVLEKARVQTRLGAGKGGRLKTSAIRETVEAVATFATSARACGARILSVATAAVRDADNRDRLLFQLQRDANVDVTVLSGSDEARLGAEAALRRSPIERGTVLDLGGGSIQITRVRDGVPVGLTSLPLGAIRLTERFLLHDPPIPRELRTLRDEVRRSVNGFLPFATPGDSLLVLGGTVRAIARLKLGERRARSQDCHGLRVHQSDLALLRERLEPLTAIERKGVQGMKAQRADIIVGGLAVLEELMVEAGHHVLTVSSASIREAILFREAERLRASSRDPNEP